MSGQVMSGSNIELVENSLMHELIQELRKNTSVIPKEQRWSIPRNEFSVFKDGNFVINPNNKEEVKGYFQNSEGIFVPDHDWDYPLIIKPADTVSRILSTYKIVLISHECNRWFLNRQIGIYQRRIEWSYPFQVTLQECPIEVYKWCDENCTKAWNGHHQDDPIIFSFNNEDDAILFKLTWV